MINSAKDRTQDMDTRIRIEEICISVIKIVLVKSNTALHCIQCKLYLHQQTVKQSELMTLKCKQLFTEMGSITSELPAACMYPDGPHYALKIKYLFLYLS